MKPQPVFPAWVWAPRPEQIPEGPAQHVEAQSAALRHCPPMNCAPTPLPTFLTPEGSKAGPPAVARVATAAPVAAAGAAAGGGAAAAAAGAAAVDEKPHPSFPCWKAAPGPEQIPVGRAQHPLAQSALLRHWPVMNCVPTPLPTWGAPLGSKGGTAATKVTNARMVAAVVNFIVMIGIGKVVESECGVWMNS